MRTARGAWIHGIFVIFAQRDKKRQQQQNFCTSKYSRFFLSKPFVLVGGLIVPLCDILPCFFQLEPFMDETFLKQVFLMMGEHLMNAKVVRNKFSGVSLGYGFLEFGDEQTAQRVLHRCNNKTIPNTSPPKRLKLNHATFGLPQQKEYALFVGELTPDVDDLRLFNVFSAKYSSVKSAKGDKKQQQPVFIIYNPNCTLSLVKEMVGWVSGRTNSMTKISIHLVNIVTLQLTLLLAAILSDTGCVAVVMDDNGISKGYGFVRFTSEADQQNALVEMQHSRRVGSKPIRLSLATPKK
ncbi:TRNAU1AP [Cordylochernes scorpioides]|uniref:tRNA selenocysteine-associated protein 1 n=1 Tax=Cordylochernes scorpioides TaxID=51811 RepID=A0ABY6KXN5_9ARAC|nr:TRNAU1AP [Cordylochernes scorpioides]